MKQLNEAEEWKHVLPELLQKVQNSNSGLRTYLKIIVEE